MDSYESEKESKSVVEQKSILEEKKEEEKEIKIINKKTIKFKKNKSKNKNHFKNKNNFDKENYYKNVNFNTNPKSIKFERIIIKDSYCKYNTILTFKSFNGILYLIYTNKQCSIISYDLIDNKKINEIKNAHNKLILNFQYYFDEINCRDLLLSMSFLSENQIKLWNINNCECILKIPGYLGCFLKPNNNLLVVSCNYEYSYYFERESILVHNLDGKRIKTIKDNKEKKFLLESYYDKTLEKSYLIISSKKKILLNKENNLLKSYDYKTKTYQIYEEKNLIRNITIINEDNKSFLIGATENGIIKKWNFHSGEFLEQFILSNFSDFSICLWNNDYLFIGFERWEKIGLIDLKSKKIIKELFGIEGNEKSIQKVDHPYYGECLISQDSSGTISFWNNKQFY